MPYAYALPAGIQSWDNDASSIVPGVLSDAMDLDDSEGEEKKYILDGADLLSWQDFEIDFDCDPMSKSSIDSSDVSTAPSEVPLPYSPLKEAELCPWQSISLNSDPLSSIPYDRLDSLVEPITNTCVECSIHFSKHQDLERHARESGHSPFLCHYCPKRYPRRDTLQRHVAKHKDPKLHCQYCKKSFTRKDHMKLHASRCAQRPSTNEATPQLEDAPCRRRPSISTVSSLEDFDPFGGMLKPDELVQLYQQLSALNETERQDVCQDILKTVGQAHANRRESIRSA